MVIVFKRWHWLLFVVFWFAQVQYLRFLVGHSPDGPAVVHFLRSLGWQFVSIAGMTAAYAFVTAVIVAKFVGVVTQAPKRG